MRILLTWDWDLGEFSSSTSEPWWWKYDGMQKGCDAHKQVLVVSEELSWACYLLVLRTGTRTHVYMYTTSTTKYYKLYKLKHK